MFPQIVLKHPVIAAGHIKQHRPHGFHASHMHRQLSSLQGGIQTVLARLPNHRGLLVLGSHLGCLQTVQKHIHGCHHIRVCIESASRKTNIPWLVFAKPLHPLGLATHHTHRQTAAQGFAVSHHVGADVKVFLRAARCQAKAQKHLVQNQGDAFLGADLAQLGQPRFVSGFVVVHLSSTIDQGRVGGRGLVHMHGLQRIDQHAGNVCAVAQHPQGVGVHFIECQGVGRRWHRVARPRLHVIPPTVISASEAHNFAFLAVVSGQAHGLHHGLGARHVKRHLVLTGNGAKLLHVVQHAGVVRAQDGPEFGGPVGSFLDAAFVKVHAKQIHAIRACDVDELVAVQIGQPHALAFTPKATCLDVLRQHAAKLKRHTVLADQLQVRHHRLGGVCLRQGLRAARLQLCAQVLQGMASLHGHRCRGTINVKPLVAVVAVAWDPLGHAFGHAQMAAERRVLGQRQLQALGDFHQQVDTDQGGKPPGAHNQKRFKTVHVGDLFFENSFV